MVELEVELRQRKVIILELVRGITISAPLFARSGVLRPVGRGILASVPPSAAHIPSRRGRGHGRNRRRGETACETSSETTSEAPAAPNPAKTATPAKTANPAAACSYSAQHAFEAAASGDPTVGSRAARGSCARARAPPADSSPQRRGGELIVARI